MKWYFYVMIVLALAGPVGGAFWQYSCNTKPSVPQLGKPGDPTHGTYPVTIEKKIAPIVYTDKNLVPYGGYIIIEPTLNAAKDILDIHAYDKYKFTDQAWPIHCNKGPDTYKKHIIGIEVYGLIGYNKATKGIDAIYGGGLNYTRMFGGTAGIGGGVMVLRGMVSKDMYYGAKAQLLFQI